MGVFYLLDFTPEEAVSIGIIGGADGPTSIFLTIQLAPRLRGPVAMGRKVAGVIGSAVAAGVFLSILG